MAFFAQECLFFLIFKNKLLGVSISTFKEIFSL